ncbi:MAG: hypothetical protein HOP15_11350, partial [Planctomycetes bacterium]|nr:hypothetical protein [Planctomycetota bacterium]
MVIARDRAADLAARAQWREALAVLQPLVLPEDAALEDLLRAANAQLAIKDEENQVERATPWIERAERLAPTTAPASEPVLLWCRHRLAAIQYDTHTSLGYLRRLRSLLPGDYSVGLALASALDDMDEPAAEEEAQKIYRELLRVPAEHSGSWRMTVLYRLAQTLVRQGSSSEAEPLFAEMAVLENRGLSRPGVPQHESDTLGAVRPHTPGLFERPAPSTRETRFQVQERVPGRGDRGTRIVELTHGSTQDVGDKQGASQEELYSFEPRATLVTFGPRGIALSLSGEATRVLSEGEVLDLVPLDRMNVGAVKGADALKKSGDRELDLVYAVAREGATELYLLENVGGKWTKRPEPLATLPPLAGPGQLLELDYDHDGDVDVLACTVQGPRLLRNDGLDGSGALTDATAEAGLPRGDFRAFSEDLDRDNDVDLLFVERASGAVHLASNERGGRFSDASASLPAGLRGSWIVAADLDGDSWVDLAVFGDELALYARTATGAWRSEARCFPLASAPAGEPRAVDWDLDGAFDLLWPCADRPAAGLLAPGFASGGVAFVLGQSFSAQKTGVVTLDVSDLDADLDLDLLRLDGSGVRAYLTEGQGGGLALALQGHKDNARGLGAVVELRAGLDYRRFYYRGRPELVGFGGKAVDVVRVTWPNGVVQSNFGFQLGAARLVSQRLGQLGSCPFLYTWNGTTYEFVSDVLGITPLGLPMAPGLPGSPPLPG